MLSKYIKKCMEIINSKLNKYSYRKGKECYEIGGI